MNLPDHTPITEVWENPAGYEPKPAPQAGMPRLEKLGEYVVVDWWATAPGWIVGFDNIDEWKDGNRPYPGPFAVRVWKRQDHQNMEKLPWNAPRAVKALYRASVQLKRLRATSAWDFLDDIQKAETAWAEYLEKSA